MCHRAHRVPLACWEHQPPPSLLPHRQEGLPRKHGGRQGCRDGGWRAERRNCAALSGLMQLGSHKQHVEARQEHLTKAADELRLRCQLAQQICCWQLHLAAGEPHCSASSCMLTDMHATCPSCGGQ